MTRRVLFIGNSFTNRNDLPGTISGLAAVADPPCQIQTDRVIANGVALKTHWERGSAREAIRREPWDYVVLQEQSTLPLKNRQRMHEYVRLFDEEIKRARAKTVLYLTWARKDVFERQDELSDAYLTIGRTLNAIVAPVGVAWQQVLDSKLEIELHDRDKSHPNPVGSYLAACVFVATLLDFSPIGLPPVGAGVEKLGPKVLQSLQKSAWKAVQAVRHPL